MSFEWILKLDDQFSAHAKTAKKSALSLSNALERVGQSAAKNKKGLESFVDVNARSSAAGDKLCASLAKIEKSARRGKHEINGLTKATGALGKQKGMHSGAGKSPGLFARLWGRGQSALNMGAGGVGGIGSAIASGAGMAAVALGGVVAAAIGFAAAAKKVFDGFMLMSRGAATASKWALDQIQFKESNLAGLETLLGSNEAAQEAFNQAIQLANKTPFSSAAVVKGFRKLIGAGFKSDELAPVFQAIGDVAAINDFDEQIIDRIGTAFAQMLGKGKFLTEELRQVVEAGGGVIGYKTVYEEIAKSIGVGVDDVQRAMERGEVTAETGINAILKVIQKSAGGQVGGGMLKQSTTLGGLLSTLKDAPASMIYNLDLKQSLGFGAVKGTVQNLITLFDSTNETGKRVQAQLLGMFDSLWSKLFGDLTGEAGLSRLEGVVGKIIQGVQSVWHVFLGGVEVANGAIDGFVNGLGMSLGKIGDMETLRAVGEVIGKTLALIVKYFVWFAERLTFEANVLGKLVKGDVGGFLWDGVTTIPRAVASLFGGGDEVAHAEGGIVNRPTRAIIGESGPEAIIPLSRSHGEGLSHLRQGLSGGASVTVNLSLDARGNDDAADLARRVAAILPSAIADALEGLSFETEGAI